MLEELEDKEKLCISTSSMGNVAVKSQQTESLFGKSSSRQQNGTIKSTHQFQFILYNADYRYSAPLQRLVSV